MDERQEKKRSAWLYFKKKNGYKQPSEAQKSQ